MAISWDDTKAAHLARHEVTIAQAEEAFYEPDAIVLNPDYNSQSGRGIRTIGYSATFGGLISVLTMVDNGVTYGNTAFPAKGKDRRYYNEGVD